MTKIKKAMNYEEAIEQTLQTVADVINQDISVKAAHEVSSLMGKTASLAKSKIEYAKLRKESPKIKFLDD